MCRMALPGNGSKATKKALRISLFVVPVTLSEALLDPGSLVLSFSLATMLISETGSFSFQVYRTSQLHGTEGDSLLACTHTLLELCHCPGLDCSVAQIRLVASETLQREQPALCLCLSAV
ncbi:uncharacterized protein UBRO_03267 [Ustilago bromivora]|uniref:Uncharacterized protein n=1 Tax=Ustilago bromivora TaxID=307758 RepID=A0A1K0HBM6_9BASI|nr:uncharacterized protein UBRO_03267 [Ustilago bromivora]SPC61581.1 uncharacterized protein UHOD_03267 [Ustilago sp. UG-2017b]